MNILDVQKLFNLGGHFGHKRGRTSPKAKPYVYKVQNNVAIIDLFQTKTMADAAIKGLFEAGKSGKELLLVATKKNIQKFATELAKTEGIHYLTEKWVGGFFTNFEEMQKNINRINTWITERTDGTWDKMIKHERNKLEKGLNKMLRVYGGVLKVSRIPQTVLMVDVKKEKNALSESGKIQQQQLLQEKEPLVTVGILDTNANPEEVTYPIMVNDDTPAVLEYVLTALVTSYSAGYKVYLDKQAKELAEEKAKAAREEKNESNTEDKKTA